MEKVFNEVLQCFLALSTEICINPLTLFSNSSATIDKRCNSSTLREDDTIRLITQFIEIPSWFRLRIIFIIKFFHYMSQLRTKNDIACFYRFLRFYADLLAFWSDFSETVYPQLSQKLHTGSKKEEFLSDFSG